MTRRDEARKQTSSSMEEVAAKRPEEVRPQQVTKEPREAHSSAPLASPPQSALRADSSSIEEERGAKSWLRKRASQLRKETTPHEKAMWRLLHQGELVALNWRRQASFGDYILDFVSRPARLVIEVDGSQHAMAENVETDAARTSWLATQGYRVLRFWNVDVMKATQGVWDAIYEAAAQTPARARMERWRAQNWATASSSMEEAPLVRRSSKSEGGRSGGGGAPSMLTNEPCEAHPQTPLVSPPQPALRADSSSIEEEQI